MQHFVADWKTACHGNATTLNDLRTARRHAHDARELLASGIDPIDARERQRESDRHEHEQAKAEGQLDHWTLGRSVRDYHVRMIEPSRTPKHAAQWLASLENHIPKPLWNKPLRDVDAHELLKALSCVRPHERARNVDDDATLAETVRRLRQRLDAVFEDAIFHKRCTHNPAAAVRRKLREASARHKVASLRATATWC